LQRVGAFGTFCLSFRRLSRCYLRNCSEPFPVWFGAGRASQRHHCQDWQQVDSQVCARTSLPCRALNPCLLPPHLRRD
jgi:hypothetical protein